MTVDTEEGLCMDDFHWDESVESYRFECTTGRSNKFYEVELIADAEDSAGTAWNYVVETRYGSMNPGAYVRTHRYGFGSAISARTSVASTIQRRLDHGYIQVKEVHYGFNDG